MRFLFLVVLLAGILAGLAYPWMVSGSEGSEIGSFRVFDAAGGFSPAVVRLSTADAPIGILSEVTAGREMDTSATAPHLTLSVASGGRTVLEQTLSLAASTPRQVSPQSPARIYRQEAGIIAAVEDGDHTFTAAFDGGDASGVKSIDIVLRSMPASIDPRVQPVGFALMAIGFVGLVLSLRRGGKAPANPNSRPPKWGRGGRQP
jgi:hypothetical protein